MKRLNALVFGIALCLPLFAQNGIFDSRGDVGVTPKAGSLVYEPVSAEYRVSGGGANVWGTQDAFQFAWRRVSGDINLQADIRFIGTGVNAHRKAMLMIRQDLDADSAYADVAVHGDGLTSLQYRAVKGGPTAELRSTLKGPLRLRIERHGDEFTILAGQPGEQLIPVGPQSLKLNDPVYVGLGVGSHEADVIETAVFANVSLQGPKIEARPLYRSKVMVHDLSTNQSSLVHEAVGVVEAPNWSRDGKFLLVNTAGNLYRLPLAGGKLEKIDLVGDYRCNNDHDLTRDGKQIAFSASSATSRQSQVYLANADGTGVKLMTPTAPSYFHGWSPDAKWLAFVGQRNGKFELYRVSAQGGAEERLTFAGAYDDGPEYTPDGKWIYFNSNRGGDWNIWRIPPSGGGPNDSLAQKITSDDLEDWFPHFSPNGKLMLFLSFPKGTTGHNGKMPGMKLRMMKTPKGKPGTIEDVVTFYGGQGTINVNSWAPDSKRFAYVVYEPL